MKLKAVKFVKVPIMDFQFEEVMKIGLSHLLNVD